MNKLRCTKCGSDDVEVKVFVKPNLNNHCSTTDFTDLLDNTDNCFCIECGENTKLKYFSDEAEAENPWRCEECGSLNIKQKFWLNPNSEQIVPQGGADRDDSWCGDCGDNVNHISEFELLENVNDWFEDHLEPEDTEVITGLDADSFATEEEFNEACKSHWESLSNEEKISLWKSLTYDKRCNETL